MNQEGGMKMSRSRKRVFAAVIGALCLAIGVGSIAMANDRPILRRLMPGLRGNRMCAGIGMPAWEFPPGEMPVERMEAVLDRLNGNRERLINGIEEFTIRISEYEQEIAEIEDETVREFAIRRLDLMKKRLELAEDRLSLLDERISLLKDELDYAKSR
jgi:hypothetical protein